MENSDKKHNNVIASEATEMLKNETVTVIADMHMGSAEARAWGCDLSYDYVKINADYRS